MHVKLENPKVAGAVCNVGDLEVNRVLPGLQVAGQRDDGCVARIDGQNVVNGGPVEVDQQRRARTRRKVVKGRHVGKLGHGRPGSRDAAARKRGTAVGGHIDGDGAFGGAAESDHFAGRINCGREGKSCRRNRGGVDGGVQHVGLFAGHVFHGFGTRYGVQGRRKRIEVGHINHRASRQGFGEVSDHLAQSVVDQCGAGASRGRCVFEHHGQRLGRVLELAGIAGGNHLQGGGHHDAGLVGQDGRCVAAFGQSDRVCIEHIKAGRNVECRQHFLGGGFDLGGRGIAAGDRLNQGGHRADGGRALGGRQGAGELHAGGGIDPAHHFDGAGACQSCVPAIGIGEDGVARAIGPRDGGA